MNASKLSTSFALLVLCVATISVAQEKLQSGTGTAQLAGAQTDGPVPQIDAPVPSMQGGETVSLAKPAETAKPVFMGRLPRYYASVVDATQREAIYQIQRTYRVRLEELRQQLAELELAETQEIEQQLSPEQRERVVELRLAAASRSMSRLTSVSE